MNIRRILLADALDYVMSSIQITLKEGEDESSVTIQRMEVMLQHRMGSLLSSMLEEGLFWIDATKQ